MDGSNELEAGRGQPGNVGVTPSSAAARPGAPRALRRNPVVLIVIAAAVAVLLWMFPLFHVVPLRPQSEASGGSPNGAAFDAAAAAVKIWQGDLRAATQRAADLDQLVSLLRRDTSQAKRKFAKGSGLGTAYYFVRGSGKVIAQDRNTLRVALDTPEPAVIAIRIGPVFGNTVRDGCGLLDVNSFPGLQEFNALAAELNALVEKDVLPALREKASVGATVQFAGCAEVPESVGGPDEPLLTIVPVLAEVR